MARYTEQQKAAFVAMLFARNYLNGNPHALKEISEEYGVARPTLRRWYRNRETPELIEKIQHEKEDMAKRFERIVLGMQSIILEALDDEDIAERVSLKDAMTIAGIGVDKMRLLNGESTENTAVQIGMIRVNRNED